MTFIFETERMLVRKLTLEDLVPFHEMHRNMNVMQYVRGKTMTFEEDKKDLIDLIQKYDKPYNDFWIYAIVRKSDRNFIGSIAFVKDEHDDEIGYRFLEKYWKNGYGTEIVLGMISYCKKAGFLKLIAYVAKENVASDKIIRKVGFEFIENSFCKEIGIQERKYKLEL